MKLFQEAGEVFLVYWYISNVVVSAFANSRTCTLESPDVCSENENCKQIDLHSNGGICECKKGYYRGDSGVCTVAVQVVTTVFPIESTNIVSVTTEPVAEPASAPLNPHRSDGGPGGLTIWIVILISLVAAVGILVILARRYKWLDRLYQLRVRRYNTVLVSSLNDDDAPIQ